VVFDSERDTVRWVEKSKRGGVRVSWRMLDSGRSITHQTVARCRAREMVRLNKNRAGVHRLNCLLNLSAPLECLRCHALDFFRMS